MYNTKKKILTFYIFYLQNNLNLLFTYTLHSLPMHTCGKAFIFCVHIQICYILDSIRVYESKKRNRKKKKLESLESHL